MRVNEGLGDNICIWVWLVFVFVSSGALECMTVNVKNEANEKLGKTVMPCPMRRARGTREEKQSLHSSTLIARLPRNGKIGRLRFFYSFCQTKAELNKARAGEVGLRQQKALILEVNEAEARAISLWPDIKAFGDQ